MDTPREDRDQQLCSHLKYLEQHGARYLHAVELSHGWLDALEVDPIELRARGLKGKKKLTEQLDAYHRLWQIGDASERAEVLRRVAEVAAVTYESRYHDMNSVGDTQFKQDATSYLRAALLLDMMGLDTTLYRAEIASSKPRLDAHLPTRGPFQRAAFHWYYGHFGLEEPFPLGDALSHGLIARRADPRELGIFDVYQLTHEIFVPYEYGDRLDVTPFSDEELDYLRATLEVLVDEYLEKRDPDITAELISCMRYLHFEDSPSYPRGLAYLLYSQNGDGSWGDRVAIERRYGELGIHRIVLHTTLVALEAITVAFHEPWNELHVACLPRVVLTIDTVE